MSPYSAWLTAALGRLRSTVSVGGVCARRTAVARATNRNTLKREKSDSSLHPPNSKLYLTSECQLALVHHLFQRELDRQVKHGKAALQRHQLICDRDRVRSPREEQEHLGRRIP